MTMTPSDAALVPTTLAMAAVVAVWIHGQIADARRQRQPRQAAIYRCETCGHVYEDSRRVPLSACERCGTLNEAVRP